MRASPVCGQLPTPGTGRTDAPSSDRIGGLAATGSMDACISDTPFCRALDPAASRAVRANASLHLGRSTVSRADAQQVSENP